MAKKEPNFKERVLFLFSPKAGNKAYAERMKREAPKTDEGPRQAASGYGAHGASPTLNSMVGWLVNGGAAEDDIDLHGSLLRQRARDLYAGGGLARSGPAALTTSVVGWGIQPKPKIDGQLLGMTDAECDEWERNTLREFRLWAENPMCDAERSKDFYTMQQLAFRSELMSGDVFVLFGMKANARTPYQTVIRILEADRISTPDTDGDSESTETEGGGRIVDGVEINSEGEVIRYHVANRHPLLENATQTLSWQAIDVFGKETGSPNILHIMTHERPEQRRGIPFCAAQIEQIKQLDRYITSELAANVVSSMLTAFIVSSEDDGKAINPIRSNSAFESFISTLETIIGASMEIPKEVLTKKYESNYTAARGALLDFWRTVRVYRTAFNNSFNQPIYEQWLSEAVALGRIDAPGFFDDPAVRQAWCGCIWMGASMGHVDPLKEVNAAQKRIQLNISTEEQEASEYNGNDWNANVRQRRKEISALDTAEEESEGDEDAQK